MKKTPKAPVLDGWLAPNIDGINDAPPATKEEEKAWLKANAGRVLFEPRDGTD